jgi:DNA-binding MarR family transcriptional regulator
MIEWKVMAMLAIEPGISGSRVAQVIGLDKAAVSRALKALEKRGLAASSVSGDHSGHRRLVLTSAGLALHSEAVSLAAERERVLLRGFSDDEKQLLISFLNRMLSRVPSLQELAERL